MGINRMKVIVEANIPFIRGYLEPMAEVVYLAPDKITPVAMRDADALITRTRTRCNAALLDGSRCRFIATATIGTDHIDLDYCRNHEITVANAPGCNAPAVAQYVFASIARAVGTEPGKTLGIVGVGHVGSIVERWGRQLGFNVLLCDPPRAENEGDSSFRSYDRILRDSDIITYHTPLSRAGKHPTFHLLDRDTISQLGKRPLIINAARGAVVDNAALLEGIRRGSISGAVIDCWENEPEISTALLDEAIIATPHIAGYSKEGKIRATQMAVNAFCRHFNLPDVEFAESVPTGAAEAVKWANILASYNPLADTAALKSAVRSSASLCSDFEHLRNTYPYRPEVK